MAHFAVIEKEKVRGMQKVIQVAYIHNNHIKVKGVESEDAGINLCNQLFKDGLSYQGKKYKLKDIDFKQTSFNKNFRHNYAGRDGYWMDDEKAFVSKIPDVNKNWTLNNKYRWVEVKHIKGARFMAIQSGEKIEQGFIKAAEYKKENWFTKLVKAIKNFLNKIFK